jgi:hypothetical protein
MKTVLLLIFILLFSTKTQSQVVNHNVNLQDLMLDCMKTNSNGLNNQIVVWMPYNFWEYSGEKLKIDPKNIQEIISQINEYSIFFVVDYTSSKSGTTYRTDNEIRKTIQLIDSANTKMRLLEDNDIPLNVKQWFQKFKPMFSQMFGNFGSGMNMFIFKSPSTEKQVIDIKAKNHFSLSWDSVKLTWTLPMPSVLPLQYCPVDQEQMKGNWMYCPIHGVKIGK